MPDLNFRVESVAVVPFAAVPLLSFRIAVTNAPADQELFSVALRCQIQLEVTRRRYTAAEQEQLLDLFGEPDRWSQTLRNMLWMNVTATVAPFRGDTLVEVQVPCSFDFNVAATKYFHAVEAGDIPLNFLFSGTAFYVGAGGEPQVSPIPWNKESRFRLPVAIWRELMNTYYPNVAWMCVRKDIFERLRRYKERGGISTLEVALERILQEAEELART